MTSHQHVPAVHRSSRREAASQHAAARQARDDGLRRIRKVTWQVGLIAVTATVFIGAKFAHLTASLPRLSGGLTGGQAGTGSTSGGSSSTGIPAAPGVSPASGGGMAVSGGS